MSGRPFDGVAHRRRVGDSLAGDVERGSVIDGHPQVRKSEGDIDRLFEREGLDGDQRLIVIHGHDHVIFSTKGGAKKRVCGERSADGHSFFACCLDAAPDLALFIPEPPALPGVRIERGGRQAWRCPVNALVLASGEARQGGDVVRLDLGDGLTKRKVDGSPVVVGQRVFIGSGDGNLYVLDLAGGKELTKFPLGKSITGSPAVGGNCLVIGTGQGVVYCLGAKK